MGREGWVVVVFDWRGYWRWTLCTSNSTTLGMSGWRLRCFGDWKEVNSCGRIESSEIVHIEIQPRQRNVGDWTGDCCDRFERLEDVKIEVNYINEISETEPENCWLWWIQEVGGCAHRNSTVLGLEPQDWLLLSVREVGDCVHRNSTALVTFRGLNWEVINSDRFKRLKVVYIKIQTNYWRYGGWTEEFSILIASRGWRVCT